MVSEYYGLVFACLSFGAIVQATLGFGMGVVSIPLMVWGGLPLPAAIGALLPNVLVQTGWSCFRNRRILPWQEVGFVTAWRFVGLPLGIFTLGAVAEQGQAYSRGLLGIGLILILLVQRNKTDAVAVTTRLSTLAHALCSGFLAGLIGMGGPALVLWVMRQDWAADRQRGFLWLCFLIATPVQMLMMWARFGHDWGQPVVLGIACTPIVIVIAEVAGQMTRNWSRQRLRSAMFMFLLVVAVRLLVQCTSDVFN